MDQGGLVVDDVDRPGGCRVLDGGQDGGGDVVGVDEGEHRGAVPDQLDPAGAQLAAEAALGAKLDPGP